MRIALMIMTAFLGLTAVAGGIGLLEGALSPDRGQLEGSPFDSYTVPALALLTIGIVSIAGAMLLKMQHPRALRAATAAGLAIIIFEAVQVRYIDGHWLQPAYALLGFAMVTIAVAETFRARRTGSAKNEHPAPEYQHGVTNNRSLKGSGGAAHPGDQADDHDGQNNDKDDTQDTFECPCGAAAKQQQQHNDDEK